jgi:hypothetical protein
MKDNIIIRFLRRLGLSGNRHPGVGWFFAFPKESVEE